MCDYTVARELYKLSLQPSQSLIRGIEQIAKEIEIRASEDFSILVDFVEVRAIPKSEIKIDWSRAESAARHDSGDTKNRLLKAIAMLWSDERVKDYKLENFGHDALRTLLVIAKKKPDWTEFAKYANKVLLERHELSMTNSRIDRIGLHSTNADRESSSPLQKQDIDNISRALLEQSDPSLDRDSLDRDSLDTELNRWISPCHCSNFSANIQQYYALALDKYGLLVPTGRPMNVKESTCCRAGRRALVVQVMKARADMAKGSHKDPKTGVTRSPGGITKTRASSPGSRASKNANVPLMKALQARAGTQQKLTGAQVQAAHPGQSESDSDERDIVNSSEHSSDEDSLSTVPTDIEMADISDNTETANTNSVSTPALSTGTITISQSGVIPSSQHPTVPSTNESVPANAAACRKCAQKCEHRSKASDGPVWSEDKLRSVADRISIASNLHQCQIELLNRNPRFATCSRPKQDGTIQSGVHVRLMTMEEVKNCSDFTTPILVKKAESSPEVLCTKQNFLKDLLRFYKDKNITVRRNRDQIPKSMKVQEFYDIMGDSQPLSKRIGDSVQTANKRKNVIVNALSLDNLMASSEPSCLHGAFKYLQRLLMRSQVHNNVLQKQMVEKRTVRSRGSGTPTIELPHDVRSCLAFNIAAAPGAFSGFHVDSLINTWLRQEFGRKVFFIAIDMAESDWQDFAKNGDQWLPHPAKTVALLMEPGDVLFNSCPHAVLTLDAAGMSGGMFWHEESMSYTLRCLKRLAQFPNLTNEDTADELDPVLKQMEEMNDNGEEILKLVKEVRAIIAVQQQKQQLQQ